MTIDQFIRAYRDHVRANGSRAALATRAFVSHVDANEMRDELHQLRLRPTTREPYSFGSFYINGILVCPLDVVPDRAVMFAFEPVVIPAPAPRSYADV